MFKRGLRALFALPLLLSSLPAFAVGTIPLSMTQQLDGFGVPLAGCLLYTIVAGTTSTPQNAFVDLGLTIPQPNPMVCDGNGRLPQFFLADGQIKIRLTDRLGNPQTVLDNILVIGPSSGTGTGATIDPTTIAATGDIKTAYGTQVITGWVRFNGRTVGSATSGATERANADTQVLFQYLWSTDANLVVSTGRGASSAADWAANKTITLPDARGRALAGLDDMGNTAAGRLTSLYFGAGPTTLGAAGGAQSHTLTSAEIPAVGFSGTTATENSAHTHNANQSSGSSPVQTGTGITVANPPSSQPTSVETSNHAHTFSGNIAGGGGAHAIVPPTILVTVYIKL